TEANLTRSWWINSEIASAGTTSTDFGTEIFVVGQELEALGKALAIGRPESRAQGLRDQRDESIPVMPACNTPASLHQIVRGRRRSQRVTYGLRPLVSGAGQSDGAREVLQAANGRTDDRAAAGQVLVQLQRIDELRVPVDFVAQETDVEMLRVRRKRTVR